MKIQLEMEIEIGGEKELLDFISKIDEKNNIALISHTDLDGISCPKIITEIIHPQKIKFVDYVQLNGDLISELKEEGIDKIIISDLYITEEKFLKGLEEFAEILILDHHKSPDWNSEKTTFIKGADGYSATYLCYYLFSKIEDIEKWDWLVACTCISDYCHVKPREWLSKVMAKYGDTLEIKEDGNIRKSGKFWDLQYTISLALVYFRNDLKKVYDNIESDFGDVGDLGEHAKEVRNEIDKAVKEFYEKKEEFDKGYFFEFKSKFPIKSIVANELSGREQNKVFVIIESEDGMYKISARRQDRKFDCSAFLQNLLRGLERAEGGGHIPAAGGHFLKKDLPIVRGRLGLKVPIKTFK